MEKEDDLFRDTYLRYLGYSNEVGEAFRAVIDTKVVWFSYGVATGYVIADAADKAFQVYKQPFDSEGARKKKTLITACDAFLWQSLASVIIPGFTINRICWTTHHSLKALDKLFKVSKRTNKVVTVAVGLASIPFIIKPIDHAVDFCMDKTIRQYIGTLQKDKTKVK